MQSVCPQAGAAVTQLLPVPSRALIKGCPHVPAPCQPRGAVRRGPRPVDWDVQSIQTRASQCPRLGFQRCPSPHPYTHSSPSPGKSPCPRIWRYISLPESPCAAPSPVPQDASECFLGGSVVEDAGQVLTARREPQSDSRVPLHLPPGPHLPRPGPARPSTALCAVASWWGSAMCPR